MAKESNLGELLRHMEAVANGGEDSPSGRGVWASLRNDAQKHLYLERLRASAETFTEGKCPFSAGYIVTVKEEACGHKGKGMPHYVISVYDKQPLPSEYGAQLRWTDMIVGLLDLNDGEFVTWAVNSDDYTEFDAAGTAYAPLEE